MKTLKLFVTRPAALLIAVLAATIAVYWPGLSGSFMLDDSANLAPVWRWLDGGTGWWQVVFGNESGPLGRPISMLSFLANAAVSGQSAISFKAANLALHLGIGVFIFLTLSLLFRRDRVFASHAAGYALAVTAIWLLHPLFSSTVLYVVQRMAILSALFVVMGLGAFVMARDAIQRGPERLGAIWMFATVPFFTILAALSKETGLLLPLLCGVVELVYYSPGEFNNRPRTVRVFLLLFVAAPAVLGLLYLLVRPEFLLAGYDNRPFGLVERLLTQARVMFDYVGSLLLPTGQEFSLYRDDYRVSTGAFTPPVTALAVVGWITLAVAAALLRRTVPGFSAGVGIFLVGHAMESGIFPLMLYFEHRNYLPGLGILIAAVALLAFLGQRFESQITRPGLLFGGALAGLLLALSLATFARALDWQSSTKLLQQTVEQYPDSRHARMELASILMNLPTPDHQGALNHYRHLQQIDRPSTRAIGHLGEIAVDCFVSGVTDPTNLKQAFSRQPETIQADYLQSVESVGQLLRRRDCEGTPATELADRLVEVADHTHLPQEHPMIWRLRFQAARLYADANLDHRALQQAGQAWQTGQADLPVGMLSAALHIRLGQFGAADKLLDDIETRIPDSDRSGQELLRKYREAVTTGSRTSILTPITDG